MPNKYTSYPSGTKLSVVKKQKQTKKLTDLLFLSFQKKIKERQLANANSQRSKLFKKRKERN
jgi:hypothetical protein